MSWLPYPRSLFSRLVLLLLFGLVLAEAVTALVLTRDRGEAIERAAGIHSAQRIAGIVKILDRMPPVQRREIVDALDAPGMHISLSIPPRENRTVHLEVTAHCFIACSASIWRMIGRFIWARWTLPLDNISTRGATCQCGWAEGQVCTT